jgi:toxin ParE1/3/4
VARILLRPKAKREITLITAYLIENASPDVAWRFRSAAQETFERLAAFPYSGTITKVRGPRYSGVRMTLVKGFPNYLVFYFPRQNGIAIERVIHAKQDYPRFLR